MRSKYMMKQDRERSCSSGRGAPTDRDDESSTDDVVKVAGENTVGQWNKIHIRNHLLDFIREGEDGG
jgi:hypothetical protein